MNKPAEVVVIGSGFGGSVIAGRLAEAGVPVTVLERGPWRDTVPTRSMGIAERSPFPRGAGLFTGLLRNIGGTRPAPFQARLNKTGLFELFFGDGVSVACSSNVGGGSHVHSAIHCRPASDDFWDGHADEVSSAGMEHHYQAALARLGSIVPTPEHKLPNTTTQRYAGSNVLEPMQPYPGARVGFLLPADPENPKRVVDANGVERQEADYHANDDGFLGSPSGAKTTVDVAYLWPAMKAGNLTVRDLTEVQAIRRLPPGAGARYEIRYRDLRAGRRHTMLADTVVLAAGGFNTLRLLLGSRDAGGLAGLPRLGAGFGTNGDVVAFWDYQNPDDMSAGLPTRGGFRLRGDDRSAVLGGGALPSIDHYPLPRRVRERLKRSLWIAAVGADAMDGAATMRDGRFHLRFDHRNSPIYDQVWSTLDQVADRTGKAIHYRRKPMTIHPMGGAALGRSAETAVVDGNGEVHGHPGLYVADSAVFPTSPGAPPSLSIAAWSNHVADRFLARHGVAAA